MAVQINSVVMPTAMASRSAPDGYLYESAEILGVNGAGDAVTKPYATLTWDWVYLTDAEYVWWVTTLLGGAKSAEFSGSSGSTQLYNHLKTLTNFSYCRVYAPVYKGILYGYYHNVRVFIDKLS